MTPLKRIARVRRDLRDLEEDTTDPVMLDRLASIREEMEDLAAEWEDACDNTAD